jgi:hypothetical protein
MLDAQTIPSHSLDPRPLDRRMMMAVAALALAIVASLVSIVFDIHRLVVIDRILSDISAANVARFGADLAAANASDHQTSAIATAELVVLVIAAVSFIVWFHRAYTNLFMLGAIQLRRGPGWAIGGWFVPILNLWRPKQIANDIYRGSDPEHPDQQPTWSEPVTPLLHWWWALWIFSGLMSRIDASKWTSGASLRRLRSAAGLDIATEVTSIVGACLAIAVIYTLTKRERERAAGSEQSDQLA